MLLKFNKRALIVCFTMSVHLFYAQIKFPNKETQKGFGQIDYLSIKMPENEKNMDFTGLHYNLKLNKKSFEHYFESFNHHIHTKID